MEDPKGPYHWIVGGLAIILICAYALQAGKLPLKGGQSVSLEKYPELFWLVLGSFGTLGVIAVVMGLFKLRR